MATATYRLHVELEDVRPRVWRLLRVPGRLSLAGLHLVLQAAMGWEDRHLYEFEVGEDVYGDPATLDGYEPPNFRDAGDRRLDELGLDSGEELTYLYDFGDSWSHRVRIDEVIEEAEADLGPLGVPRVADGARRCPPEDCGGAPGYAEMLEALDDPSHPEHDGWRDWIGPDFDPEAFSTDVANAALLALCEPGGRLAGQVAGGGRPD